MKPAYKKAGFFIINRTFTTHFYFINILKLPPSEGQHIDYQRKII